jgi:hypothetical protein
VNCIAAVFKFLSSYFSFQIGVDLKIRVSLYSVQSKCKILFLERWFALSGT